MYHTGAEGGRFHTLNYFDMPLAARYGEVTGIGDYFKKSNLAVYETHRAMFEAYNQKKQSTTTGIIQWMLNNPWPSMIWHLFDYYYEPTAAYFAVKKANEPIHIQYDYNKSI